MTGAVDAKASKKSSSSRGSDKAARFNEYKFVQYEPDKTQQAMIKAWAVDEVGVFEAVEAMVTDGYKFSIKHDDYGDCFGCYITCPQDSGSGNRGLILTGRGSSAWKAVKQVLWKHAVALDGDWTGFVERTSSASIDD